VAVLVASITNMQTLDFAEHSGSITASTSLVRRVKSQDPDAWRRLARIYGPLVYRWARTSGLQAADAEDIVGEVFAGVVIAVERFRHDGLPHSFRRWLRTIASRSVMKSLRKRNSRPVVTGGTTAAVHVQSLADEAFHERQLETQDEIEWLRQRAMRIIQDDYKPSYWEVFRRVSLEGEAPAEVARAKGMSVWAVYKVQSRILNRLRAELDELG
jgi:RNA polymerase sigma-70 factor (ECF subfamily)